MAEGKSVLKHTLLYGLTLGGIITIYQLILFYFGMGNKDSLKNIGIFFAIVGVFIAVKHYREDLKDGLIEFGKTFITSWSTCMFTGLVVCIYIYILHKYLLPGLVQEKIGLMLTMYSQKGFSEDQLNMFSELFRQIVTPLLIAASSLINIAFWGALFSLFVAVLLKRPANPVMKSE